MKKLLLLALVLQALLVGAQPRFTYADIAAGKFTQRTVSGVLPSADPNCYYSQEASKIMLYRYDTGITVRTAFDGATHKPAIRFADYSLSAGEDKLLLATNPKPIYRHSFSADWLIYDIKTAEARPLTQQGGEQQPMFSPDGSKVGFVRDNDLYVVELKDMSVKRITTDGERNRIINGLPDWVYEEEYGFSRAFEFSPDGNRIAWMRFDESAVREFTFMKFDGDLYPQPYTYKYPKAGEANSKVEVFTADLTTGNIERAELDYTELYIPRIGFTLEGKLWIFCVNRLQNQFEVVVDGRLVYEETAERYVERPDDGTVTFLKGDQMVVMNETSGYRHLYLYKNLKGKTTFHPITSGKWDVDQVVKVADGKVWYTSSEGSPLRRNLWCVGLDGKNKKRLTTGEGNYRIAPGEEMRYYLSYFSNAATPLQVTVHRGDGTLVRTVQDNAALKKQIASVKMPVKEFFTIPAADGTPLNAYIMRPEGFDSAKKYPVLMTQYSGPGSQQVLDRWSVDWEDVVVQHGYVVVCVDPRGTGMRGREFRQCTYGQLGHIETLDQIAAARWLQNQSWTDASRIGIYGWSYGGFMALNCILKGADIFSMAIAVAPVTSWRFYDSIYTEIYNGLPQQNPAGYDDPSPLPHAHMLKGKLLIVHGTADDNVHIQNTYEMAAALTRAGKQFDMAIYPDCNHSMVPSGRTHIRERMVEYTLKNL